jgi:hypothetical protein
MVIESKQDGTEPIETSKGSTLPNKVQPKGLTAYEFLAILIVVLIQLVIPLTRVELLILSVVVFGAAELGRYFAGLKRAK